jgi:hypothetical protein
MSEASDLGDLDSRKSRCTAPHPPSMQRLYNLATTSTFRTQAIISKKLKSLQRCAGRRSGRCNESQNRATIEQTARLGGTFKVTSLGSAPGGKLIVTGFAPATQNASVYMTDVGSSVELSQQSTLECDNDYRQVGGVLETLDFGKCTLQDGFNGQGTATISGGGVALGVNTADDEYGLLSVNCTLLKFAAPYYPRVIGGSISSDGLNVNGDMDILPGSYLQAEVVGTALSGNKWTIITADNQLARFSGTNDNVTGLTDTPNEPLQGWYQLKKI